MLLVDRDHQLAYNEVADRYKGKRLSGQVTERNRARIHQPVSKAILWEAGRRR
jgi:hypothetical protein